MGERLNLTASARFGTLDIMIGTLAVEFQTARAAEGAGASLTKKGPGMTKSGLILRLAELRPHLFQREAQRIVTTVFEEITAALARGDRVELRGFGAFSIKRRDSRVGRNPRTGVSVNVDQKLVPFFKTGKQLRERLNQGNSQPTS